MANKKKSKDYIQTTARIPNGLHREVGKLCGEQKIDQLTAINEGLLLWIVLQESDKQLATILTDAAKKVQHRIDRESEELREKAAKASVRRLIAG